MNIRLAQVDDASQILKIYAPHILETAVSFETEVPSLVNFKKRIRETMLKFPWLVCESEGQVQGYSYASPYRSRSAYSWSVETSIYIDRNHHGRGMGTRLYRELFKWLREQGVVNIFAGITQPNQASVRLHESLGFISVGNFKEVGFKQGKWWDVGWWQLQLQKVEIPKALTPCDDVFLDKINEGLA